MSYRRNSLLAVLLLFTAVSWCIAQNGQPPRRAEPPKFDPATTSGIFFDDLFTEGFSGTRPANLGAAPTRPIAGNPGGNPAGNGNESTEGSGAGWSKMISSVTIEDEIKSIKLKADQDITTPSDFAGKGYKTARKNFSVLAMLFAIIGEYEGNVRWKESAPHARDLFARTAANSKVGTQQVYNEAKLRKQDLQDLIGGSQLQAAGEVEQAANWGKVIDRSPLMQRLETAFNEKVRAFTGNQGDFKANAEELKHEAEMIAAMSEVLCKDGMEDGDDEEYAAFAQAMKKAATEIVDAVKLNNYEQARGASGEISKACSQCHENYRA